MPGSSAGGPNFESVFHHTSVDLYIPAFSSIARDTDEGVWWESIKDAPLRQVTFLGASIFLFCALLPCVSQDRAERIQMRSCSTLSRSPSRTMCFLPQHRLPPPNRPQTSSASYLVCR